MITRTLASPLAIAMLLALTPGASSGAPSKPSSFASRARIMCTASYRERVALTPNASFEATLEDVSRADTRADVIARIRRDNPGQVPIAFQLSYDRHRIKPGHRYVVRATIHQGERLRFTGQQAVTMPTPTRGGRVSVLMRGVANDRDRDGHEWTSVLGDLPATFTGLLPCADCRGTRYQLNLLNDRAYMLRMTYLRDARDETFYELGRWSVSNDGRTLTLDGGREGSSYWAAEDPRTLRKLDREGGPFESGQRYELNRRAAFEPIEPRLQLTGMFRYIADAARFRDCRSGLQWPVAMSDDYPALERAYTGRHAARGSELLVSLSARIEERQAIEGENTEPTLVVERFLRAMPGEDCPARSSGTSSGIGLTNTRWRPLRIGDLYVTVSAQRPEPWIELDSRSGRVTGSGGCNRLSGSYETSGDALRFGPLMGTQMACLAMDTETAFFRALGATSRYRIVGRSLELFDERGRSLAKLEERNLR